MVLLFCAAALNEGLADQGTRAHFFSTSIEPSNSICRDGVDAARINTDVARPPPLVVPLAISRSSRNSAQCCQECSREKQFR